MADYLKWKSGKYIIILPYDIEVTQIIHHNWLAHENAVIITEEELEEMEKPLVINPPRFK